MKKKEIIDNLKQTNTYNNGIIKELRAREAAMRSNVAAIQNQAESNQVYKTLFNTLTPLQQAQAWQRALTIDGYLKTKTAFKEWKESLTYEQYETLREIVYRYIYQTSKARRFQQTSSDTQNDS